MVHNSSPKRILTWHIHGSYLYYLSHTPHIFYLPVKPHRAEGYFGKTPNFAWGKNVREIPADQVRHLPFDAILFQSSKNYLEDQFEILSPEQRTLPKLYLEHDPPRAHPTDTTHYATTDPTVIIVHVTHFNKLMWDNGSNRTVVIEHGITIPESVKYTGVLNKGIVVVNNLALRGRRLGKDIVEQVRKIVPLDIVGMQSKEVGGLGEIPLEQLPEFMSRYRFFFNPIRYTSLGLALGEAMMVGVPIIGLATTEVAVTIQNGVTGYIHTNPNYLVTKMQELIHDRALAQTLSINVRSYAQQRFNIERFSQQWNQLFTRL